MAKNARAPNPFIQKLRQKRLRSEMKMDLKLVHNYLVRDIDDAFLKKDTKNITDLLIRQAIAAKYPNGIKTRAEQRHAAKLQNALTLALKDEKQTAISNIDGNLVKWLYDVLKDWSAPAPVANWFIDLLDYVEELVRQVDAEENAKKPA